MNIVDIYDYRNAKAILESTRPGTFDEISSIFSVHELDFSMTGAQRNLSRQMQYWFSERGWEMERESFSVSGMRYDLVKENIPIEIELGHQRLVYPDFFEFLADYSKGFIPCAIMIVTGNPEVFGHEWHCSIQSTVPKIRAIKEVFLVPLLLIAVNP